MSRRAPKLPVSRKERSEILGRVRMIGVLLAETENIIANRWPATHIGDKWHRIRRSFRILSEDLHEHFKAPPPSTPSRWEGES